MAAAGSVARNAAAVDASADHEDVMDSDFVHRVLPQRFRIATCMRFTESVFGLFRTKNECQTKSCDPRRPRSPASLRRFDKFDFVVLADLSHCLQVAAIGNESIHL